jgi:GntR family transcriptional regulator
MNTQIVRSPVYQQLNERLRASLSADYHRGEQFLTEREISERFQVSRATANKALAGLVSEGLLEFRKGVGTFVRRDRIDYDVRSLVSFTEKARAAGKKPATKVLAFAAIAAADAAPAVRAAFQLGDTATLAAATRRAAARGTTTLWELRRLRLADGVPVILEHRFIMHARCPRLTQPQVAGSLYRAWTESHGLQIAGADEVIRAVPLTAAEARQLHVPARTPALEVVAVGFLADDTPLWWERTLYRSDHYELHSRLGPIQSATPARGVLR